MPKRDLRGTDLSGETIEDTAPQPRAQGARSRAVQQIVHDAANVRMLDAILPAALLACASDQVVPESLVSGIDTDGHQRELDGSPPSQHVKNVQQCPAVLASRETDHHTVTVLDQRVLGDRLGDLLCEPRFKR